MKSTFLGVRCALCETEYEDTDLYDGCPRCAADGRESDLLPTYDYDAARQSWSALTGRGLWRYAPLLPVREPDHRISLGEGDTPLVPWPDRGVSRRLWIKNESANPTWSYKDRMCAVAVSLAAPGAVVGAASTGNHGAAAAAYAARAGRDCVVFTRDDIGEPTLTFMAVFGARVLRTTRVGRWALLAHGVRELGWCPATSFSPTLVHNPYGVEGYKTIAFEIVEELGGAPEVVVVPTAYGEGLSGIWSGFRDLARLGRLEQLPRLVAAETAGGAPLHEALANGAETPPSLPEYTTVATSIASVVAKRRAARALRESDGIALRVTDEDILETQAELARGGVFGEPSGVVAAAAVSQLPGALRGFDPDEHTVVAVMTGGGLREPAIAARRLTAPARVEPDPTALERLLAA